jgi:hypothetical protein
MDRDTLETLCAEIAKSVGANWNIMGTGGGCTAWCYDVSASEVGPKGYLMVESDLSHYGDPHAKEWSVGVYNSNGDDWICAYDYRTLDEALRLALRLAVPAENSGQRVVEDLDANYLTHDPGRLWLANDRD